MAVTTACSALRLDAGSIGASMLQPMLRAYETWTTVCKKYKEIQSSNANLLKMIQFTIMVL